MKSMCHSLIVALSILAWCSTALAQEVRLEGLSMYTEASPRHLMAARVWTTREDHTWWAGGRLDWKSRSLTPVIGLSQRLASGRRYTLLLRTEAEVLMLAPPQGALGMGLGMGALNQWVWRRIEMHLGARARARFTLTDPVQATRTLTGVWTLSRRLQGKHSVGVGVEAGQVNSASGSALLGTAQLSYGF